MTIAQLWQELGINSVGYMASLYHLCNFSVKLKLFQNK